MSAGKNEVIWAIDPVHSKVRFDARYLMISAVSGWFRELEGTVIAEKDDFSGSAIQFTIYTGSLDTGIEERDRHLRSADFFDVARYPTIRFVSSSVKAEGETLKAGRETLLVSGTLHVKDVTQEISFPARYLGSLSDPMGNTKAGFELDVVFNRKDLHISWNQFFDKQGILISDEVHIHCDVQLLKLQ